MLRQIKEETSQAQNRIDHMQEQKAGCLSQPAFCIHISYGYPFYFTAAGDWSVYSEGVTPYNSLKHLAK
jgi:hypothetical protein